jgi:hypothetical protein
LAAWIEKRDEAFGLCITSVRLARLERVAPGARPRHILKDGLTAELAGLNVVAMESCVCKIRGKAAILAKPLRSFPHLAAQRCSDSLTRHL